MGDMDLDTALHLLAENPAAPLDVVEVALRWPATNIPFWMWKRA